MSGLPRFWASSIGKKTVMAVTGLALLGFVVGHLAGNLLVFAGPAKLNAYAEWLHARPGVLWGARLGLLAAVALHIVAAVQLAHMNRAARPVGYAERDWARASYASRTMVWSGPLIALYVVYHLLHFTFGSAHPAFDPHNVYRNVVTGFQVPLVSGVYVAAMLCLGLHLHHGFWSMFQTAGANHPRFTPLLEKASAALAAAITLGYIAIPAAVLAGWVR
jgi:succinate dehydrogenase / fumarate reductase cytochrome b subunit